MTYGPQVDERSARQDGRSPEDFRFEQWPVSNVRIENSTSRYFPFFMRCDIAEGTPLDNQYVEARDRKPDVLYQDAGGGWWKIPDPVGMCLARVEFELWGDGESLMIAEADTLPTAGVAQGKPGRRDKIWQLLTPRTTIKVRLFAYPVFYFLNEQGGMVSYSTRSDGHFVGDTISSPLYSLFMDDNGSVMVSEV